MAVAYAVVDAHNYVHARSSITLLVFCVHRQGLWERFSKV